MPIDLTGIQNQNQFYSDHYLAAIFEGDLRPLFEKWSRDETEQGIETPQDRIRKLGRSFLKSIRECSEATDGNERLALQRSAYRPLLEALGYEIAPYSTNGDDGVVIPVLAEVRKAHGEPELWVLEALNPSTDAADTLELSPLPEQFPTLVGNGAVPVESTWDDVITRYVFGSEEPPRWVLLCGGGALILLDRTKWPQKRVLRFDLLEIFNRQEATTFKALAALLHRESVCPSDRVSLLDTLDEKSHKHAFSVSADLKYSAREAVELIGNEAVWYLSDVLHEKVYGKELAVELTREALRYLYRLLFLFYVEAREELQYAPMKSDEYRMAYSLESLRSVAEVPLTTEESREGYYLHESLQLLFRLVFDGFQHGISNGTYQHTFCMEPLRSDLFDPEHTPQLNRVRMRNKVVQRVLELLSLSRPRRNERRGRISYAQLGINQLGSVYEGLLSYTGFFAEEDLYEVQRAGETYDPLAHAFFVPASEMPNYTEEEQAKDESGRLRKHAKGSFIYRLAGRDREKSASFYTQESLTQCVVKYALKELLKDKTADTILNLNMCEPALGSGAFANEAVNQLADAYLARKQQETGRSIRHEDYVTEKQKVKAFLADNRVFGIDRNPIAIQLAEISLWLNTIYAGHTIPWFGGQLVVGNSLIGARRQTFTTKQLQSDNREWFGAVPEKVALGVERTADQVWHFLCPDQGMVSYSDREVKKMTAPDQQRIRDWRRDFLRRFDERDAKALLRLADGVDRLWEKHTADLRQVRLDTAHIFPLFGHEDEASFAERGHRLTTGQRRQVFTSRILGSDSGSATPYQRLKLGMDYWCALWFWPIEQSSLLPTRDEFLLELQAILEGTLRNGAAPLFGAEQQALFKGGPAQQEQLRLAEELGDVDLESLCKEHPRLRLVRDIADRHRFLHWELEFADIFRDRGGFDLIVGNPPWIKIEWNEGGVLGDFDPLYVIRQFSAPELALLRNQAFEKYERLRRVYLDEYVEFAGLQNFLSARQNYSRLQGAQSNTFKCFVTRCWEIVQSLGVQGFLHPDGVYDDPNGGLLRGELFRRLRFHFQFLNERQLFPENDHHMKFGVNVYGMARAPGFDHVSNLFAVHTVDDCYEHSGSGVVGGIKDENNDWNEEAHAHRIIQVDEETLGLFARLYDAPGTRPLEARLPSLHARELVDVLRQFASYRRRLGDLQGQYETTEMWHETNAVMDGTMRRETRFPRNTSEWILSGPHIGVANPLQKTPRRVCAANGHYDLIDLRDLPEDYLPRTNYVPACDVEIYRRRMPKVDWGAKLSVDQHYRIVNREMLSQSGERTLITAIYPPGVGHVHTCFEVAFKETRELLNFASLAMSLPVDYRVKSTGMGHANRTLLEQLPLLREGAGLIQFALHARVLLLNCLTSYYALLWKESFRSEFTQCGWAREDQRLSFKKFGDLSEQWYWHTPLRSDFERRQALLEMDVLSARVLGLTVDELISIYRIQFPVFRQYERATFFDRNGRIVFLDGDRAYGFSRPEWERVKDLQNGTVERRYTDDTLPTGPREKLITYVAPFDCPDREADYREAWACFEGKGT